jgi:hypothetical protein
MNEKIYLKAGWRTELALASATSVDVNEAWLVVSRPR